MRAHDNHDRDARCSGWARMARATCRDRALGRSTLVARKPLMLTANAVRYCAHCHAVYRSDFQCCPSDGAELTVAPGDPLLGTTLADQYVIDGLIGEGAMARVYRAHHARFITRCYAVK